MGGALLARTRDHSYSEAQAGAGGPVEEALAATTSALSGLSACAGLVMVPKREGVLRSIGFVPLGGAQALAVIRDSGLDPSKVNPLGGAIALGHPLGATGAVRTATIVHGMRRRRQKYGMVTMCIGTGMGAAGIFEAL